MQVPYVIFLIIVHLIAFLISFYGGYRDLCYTFSYIPFVKPIRLKFIWIWPFFEGLVAVILFFQLSCFVLPNLDDWNTANLQKLVEYASQSFVFAIFFGVSMSSIFNSNASELFFTRFSIESLRKNLFNHIKDNFFLVQKDKNGVIIAKKYNDFKSKLEDTISSNLRTDGLKFILNYVKRKDNSIVAKQAEERFKSKFNEILMLDSRNFRGERNGIESFEIINKYLLDIDSPLIMQYEFWLVALKEFGLAENDIQTYFDN